MAGAPSQFDCSIQATGELNESAVPDSVIKGERFAFIIALPSCSQPAQFSRFGQLRASFGTAPHLAPARTTCDHPLDVAAPSTTARRKYFSYRQHAVRRPSMGSWLTYLGDVTQNLPGFVVMISFGGQPYGGVSSVQWVAAHRLPGRHSLAGRSRIFPFEPGRHDEPSAAARSMLWKQSPATTGRILRPLYCLRGSPRSILPIHQTARRS